MHPDGPGNPVKNVLRRGRRFLHECLGREVRDPRGSHHTCVHLGTEYGGWWVIPNLVPENACVFSIGIGQDISFDLGMIKRFNSTIYGFDPTPVAMDWISRQQLPPQFHFIPVGLAHYDGEADFGLNRPDWESYSVRLPTEKSVHRAMCRVARFVTLAREAGVSKVDILKVDIEGSEYDAIPDVLKSGFTFSQFLLELHYGTGVKAELTEARNLLRLIEDHGYRLFKRSATGREFCFVHSSALAGAASSNREPS